MKISDEQRAKQGNCSVCGKLLRSDSTGGMHNKCRVKAGASKSTVLPPRKSAAKPLTPLIRATRAVLGIGEATANICVPEAALDNFWSKLTVEEKADLFVRQLQGD